MASLRISQGSVLRQALHPLRYMDFTANIDFSQSGLSVIASHPHRPFVIILKINPAGCDYFFCDEGRTIGVDLMDFRIKLTSLNFGDDGSVCIAISAEEGTITFYFESKHGASLRSCFSFYIFLLHNQLIVFSKKLCKVVEIMLISGYHIWLVHICF